jgi:hypothetical protein
MPKIVSTSSSSSDRITAWAPVTSCGAIRLGCTVFGLVDLTADTASPLGGAVAARSGGRVVGALTSSS